MACLESGLTLEWTIENFHFFPKDKKRVIKSPSFSLNSLPLISWEIEIQKSQDSLFCSLLRSSGKNKNVNVEFSLSLKIGCGEVYGEKGVAEFKEGEDRKFLRSLGEPKFTKLFENRIVVLTCHLTGQFYPQSARAVYCFARSHIEVDNFYFDWIIPNFDTVYESQFLRFPVSKTWKESLPLEIVIKVANNRCTLNDFLMDVYVTNLDGSTIEQHCKVTLLNCFGNTIATAVDDCLFETRGDCLWRISNFEGDCRTPIHSFLPDNNLKMSFEFGISRGKDFTWMEGTKSLSRFVKKPGTIIPEIKHLQFYKNGITNVDLKVGEKIFSVHREYLCAISPYFRDLDEKSDGDVLVIHDTNEEAFEEILNILYVEEMSDSFEFSKLYCLYLLSQRFQIIPLIKMLSKEICAILSIENLCDVLNLASTYKDKDLQEAAQKFFNANAKEVLKSNVWKSFQTEAPEVAGEVVMNAFKLVL